mgnify:CR=1 FL=1
MNDISPFLKQLISLPGLSANEGPVREVIAEKWRPLVDELSVSRLGSLHGLRRASRQGPVPGILIATHMDAIGLMVTGIHDGFLTVTQVGGIDPRILPGQIVTVHGRQELSGLAILWPDRLVKTTHKGKAPNLDRILIDIGLPENDVKDLVRVGDLVSFASTPTDLAGSALTGHTLDNRASVAALTICLEELRKVNLDWDLWAAATVQEEVSLAGAATSPAAVEPAMVVAVDVTFAKGPGASDHRTFPLGKGPTIGVGSNIHPYMYKQFKTIAEENDIPYAIETMPRNSGTDAMYMQIVNSGIPCAVIGIPLRYMHTPVEEVVLSDIQRTGRLLAAFIKNLEPDTLDQLSREMRP